jgi:succinate dehydrogenase/fumarate reductase flavoprotein subunit
VKARLHTISPNVPLVFDRWSIDPYGDRFEVTLHNDDTIRDLGGLRVVNADCATSVPGLFVVGDNASREKAAGAISGGGNVNSAWALSFGVFAGQAAARLAREADCRSAHLKALGRVGLRPGRQPKALDLAKFREGRNASVRKESVSHRRAT